MGTDTKPPYVRQSEPKDRANALISMFPQFTTYLLSFLTLAILLLGFTLFWSWIYATRSQLIKEDAPESVRRALLRRVLGAQALYAAGALLCVINTYVSIAAIVLVQLNFAVGLKIRWLSRI